MNDNIKVYINKNHSGYRFMPKAKPEKFHFLISKNSDYAYELQKILNIEIEVMEQSGALNNILNNHIR